MTEATLDRALAALVDPTRRSLVRRLARGPARVTDLAFSYPMSLNAVSKHIKVLESAGLVVRRRVGREHILRLRARPIRDVHAWSAGFERFWSGRLDALESQLAADEG